MRGVSLAGPRAIMHVTKRSLGESYIVGTGIVLGGLLAIELLGEGGEGILWGSIGLIPVLALVGGFYWLGYLGLDSEQVWTVAECSALAMGAGTLLLFALEVLTQELALGAGDTLLVGSSIATVAGAGAFGGVVWELHRSKRRLGLRNEVMHRVLRHNLRNDMTVVLCLLDEIEATANEHQQQPLDEARAKIDGLVEMTDKVRQVNFTATTPGSPTNRVDLADVVETRVEEIRAEHPDTTIETDLPERAVAPVDGEFGVVIDNVVESGLTRAGEPPEMHITVDKKRGSVVLEFEDFTGTIPEADLSAVAAGSETDLEHGFGVELWLVHWLVEVNGGSVTFETDGDTRRIRIELDTVRGRLLSL